ncbi:MAG: T9SS type A sorting domain-containing protein [Saprospiraceae bacterium]|nr:T9SS type A sorting domain-containing protein [Saprospiraceae bacterium]
MSRFLLLALLGCASPIFSQTPDVTLCYQVLGSTGKSAVRAGRYYAYTIGEPFITTLQGSKHLTQGFHQPELCVLVATHDVDLADWQIEVFPNPTADFLHIKYSPEHTGRLEAAVFNLLGQLIVENIPLNQPDGSLLDCATWQAGLYFLQLRDPATHAVATVRFIRL